MSKLNKSLLAAALLLVSPALGLAADGSSWDEAFPAQDSYGAAAIQGLGATNELLYGAALLPIGGKASRDISVAESQAKLDAARTRLIALENVGRAHPEHAAAVEKLKKYDLLYQENYFNPLSQAKQVEMSSLYGSYLDSLNTPERSELERLLKEEGARLGKLPGAGIANVKAEAHYEKGIAKQISKAKLIHAATLGIAAALVADGAVRGFNVLTGRSSGVLPAVAAGVTLLKPSAPRAIPAAAPAETSMEVK